MKEIVFATTNESKMQRFSRQLLEKQIKLLSLKDINKVLDVEEDGKTAIENALIKARAYHKEIDKTVMAMDDTLYLEGVPDSKQPGMYVRRVNGKRLTDDEMIEYYSSLVKEYGNKGKINAHWVYGLAIINNGIEYTYTWSNNYFFLVDVPSKIRNEGYPLNSLSIDKSTNKYFSEMAESDKIKTNADESDVVDFIISHV